MAATRRSTLVMPILCHDGEYDHGGARTKSGQLVAKGDFLGEIAEVIRDQNGRVTDRLLSTRRPANCIDVKSWDLLGKPKKPTISMASCHWRQKFTYNPQGNMAEWVTLDSTEKEVGRVQD